MKNARPIESPRLRRALREFQKLMDRHGLAGACMLVDENESAFTYGMHAPWSAIQPEPGAPLGFRIRAVSATEGAQQAHKRLEGAMHTICQLADFGAQTVQWMEDIKQMMRNAGVEFEHTPFGGEPLPHLGGRSH